MFCEKCGDKVDTNEQYCNNCGNYVGNQQNNINNTSYNMFGNNVRSFNQQMMNMNYNQQSPQNYQQPPQNYNQQFQNNNNYQQPTQNKNEQLKALALGIGCGAIALIVFGFAYMFIFGNNIYLSDEPYEEQGEIKKEEPTTKSKYKTVIVYDNKYDGVEITTEKEANKLIVKDSTSQKSTCSEEIVNIENEIIKKYGITAVNLCEMEPDFAKEVGNVFKKIYEEYPGTEEVLTNLTLVNASMSDGYIAAFQPIFTFATNNTESTYPWVLKTQIYLNTTYFLNQERLKSSVEDGSNSGHFPPNATMYSPVAHEMGHYLSFLAMMNNYDVDSILIIEEADVSDLYNLIDDFAKGTFSLKMIKEAHENFKKDTGSNIDLDVWRETISSYAVAKDNSGNYIYDETIAESFHDVYLNGETAADASKYVVAVLKKYLGEGEE